MPIVETTMQCVSKCNSSGLVTDNAIGNVYTESLDGVHFVQFCRPFFCYKESKEAISRAYLYDEK